MIITLIRHERILRSMRWLPIGLAMGAFLLALKETPPPGLPFFASDFRPQYLFFPALFFWAILVPYMLAYGATTRSGRYQMALPIPARDAWLAHILALVLSALAVIALAAAVLVVGNHLQGNPLLEPDLKSLMVNVAAFVGLGIVLTQIPRRDLSEVPLTADHIAYIVFVWGGLVFVVSLWSALPLYWAAAPAAVAVGLAAVVYRSLPSAFAMVPRQPAPYGSTEDSWIPTGPIPSDQASAGLIPGQTQKPPRWLVHRTVMRSLYNPVIAPILFVIILIFGLRNSGYNYNGISNLIWIFWTLVCMSALFIMGAAQLHLLDPLPISRRTIFAYLVLPGLFFTFLSYGLGGVTGKGAVGGMPLVEYEERYYDEHLDVRVPLEFWEIGRDSTPPPLEPCCDEPHAAWSVPLFRGTGLVLYNPFHAPADSSPEFVARQFSLATEAVYGRQIPAQDLLDRYFGRRPDGGTALRTGKFNLLEDYPELTPVGWGRRLAAVLAAIGVVWLLYLSVVLRLGHARIVPAHVAFVVLSVIFLFTMIWTSNRGYTDDWKISTGAAILVRNAAEALPGSTPVLWLTAAALIAGCYLLARAQFGRLEITVRRDQK